MYRIGLDMVSINVTEFRKHLPSYLNQVKEGKEVYLTSHGKVIAKVVPEIDHAAAAREKLAELRQTAVIGDILSPVEDIHWGADEDNL